MAKRTIPGDTKRAVAYLRVSTDDQHLGPEAQRASIESWAKREGVEVVAWHLDQGVSGGTPVEKRPALVAALGDLHDKSAGVLVAAKRDRLARDVVIASVLERMTIDAGASIVTADGVSAANTPEGALMRVLLDAFAAYERACIRSRTKAALGVKKNRGERVGTLPLGHAIAEGKRIAPTVAHELRAVARAHELRSEGVSIRGVVARLELEGFTCRTGRAYGKASVENMLRKSAA